MYFELKGSDTGNKNIYELYQGESKKALGLAGYGIKGVWPMFRTKMLIYWSKVNLEL